MKVDYSLYLIIDDTLCPPLDMPCLVSQLINCGITCIQLRMKHSSVETITNVGKTLLRLLKSNKIPLIINDHIEIAANINADGVHIGQKDTPYASAREYLGYRKIIGLSIENCDQAEEYSHCDADYFGVGPIFPTNTKCDAANPIGIQQLSQINHVFEKPVVAIGGINRTNIISVLKTGV